MFYLKSFSHLSCGCGRLRVDHRHDLGNFNNSDCLLWNSTHHTTEIKLMLMEKLSFKELVKRQGLR